MTRDEGKREMSESPVHPETAAAIRACRDDLTRVADGLRWAHNDGYHPAGRALDAPPGRALEAEDDRGQLPGPTWDVGQGAHRSRVAYQRAVRLLAFAEVRLASAVFELGTRRQPPLAFAEVAANRRALVPSLPLALIVTEACGWRLTIVDHDLPLVDGATRKRVERHVTGERLSPPSARQALDLAVRAIDSGLSVGSVAALRDREPRREIPPHLRCVVCRIRKGRPRDSGRCTTCAKYLRRNGVERPRHLDGVNPYDARRKRHARGEGWGDESASGTRRAR